MQNKITNENLSRAYKVNNKFVTTQKLQNLRLSVHLDDRIHEQEENADMPCKMILA